MKPTPWSPRAFEELYSACEDPWKFRDSPYERRRYEAIVEALPTGRLGHVLEAGCANGELTALLAQRAARVTAFDVSPTVIRLARDRCRHHSHVRAVVADLRSAGEEPLVPVGSVDVMILSEVGYYLSVEELRRAITALMSLCHRPATWVSCHWLGHSADHRLHGQEVHAELRLILGAAEWRHSSSAADGSDAFLLERWTVQ